MTLYRFISGSQVHISLSLYFFIVSFYVIFHSQALIVQDGPLASLFVVS
jgi:hypothetical protein